MFLKNIMIMGLYVGFSLKVTIYNFVSILYRPAYYPNIILSNLTLRAPGRRWQNFNNFSYVQSSALFARVLPVHLFSQSALIAGDWQSLGTGEHFRTLPV